MSKQRIILAGVVILVIGGMIALMTADIPAPQKPVEKELDAKTFLEPKPQQ